MWKPPNAPHTRPTTIGPVLTEAGRVLVVSLRSGLALIPMPVKGRHAVACLGAALYEGGYSDFRARVHSAA